MPDESDFINYKTVEEFSKTLEGNRYYHSLYLKAINNKVRRQILEIVKNNNNISKNDLFSKLKEKGVVKDEQIFNFHVDFLIKALCLDVKHDEKSGESYYSLTKSGKVIDFLR